MSKQVLLLVDGLSVIYRAFHAIHGLGASDGRPTNAVFGFVRMWQQMVRLWAPTHAAVVFDGGLPESRLAALAEYKAQRPPMPEALRQQLPEIEEFLRCSGVVAVRIEGQEADDVIATLAEKAARDGVQVLIASSDKDLFQLVNDQVVVVTPSKDGQRIGPNEVLEKTGVAPEQISEWLALTGDTVDNIPGVPGVGGKTAAQWLQRYGSLAALKASLKDIPSDRLRTALSENWEVVERNLEMVRLKRDLPVAIGWPDLKLGSPRTDDLIRFYERMEFRSLADELRRSAGKDPQMSFGF
jgi:DNA polymerase-1